MSAKSGEFDVRVKNFNDAATGFGGWRARLRHGRGIATPAIGQGRVFVGGGYGTYQFYAFDAATGALDWTIRTEDDGPTAAVVADGCVVFNTESCTLYVVEAETGKTVWKKWMGDPLMAQPAVEGNRVFMAYPDRRGTHQLAAFELQTGEPLWQTPLPAEIISAPILADGNVYCSTFDGCLHCVDVRSGEVLWKKDRKATSAPWIWNGEAFVAERDGEEHQPTERTSRIDHGRVQSSSGLRQAGYLRSKRMTSFAAFSEAMDASVGFGMAPGAAKLHEAEKLVGEYTVYGAWRYQGSRPCVRADALYTTVGEEVTAWDVTNWRQLWGPESASQHSHAERLLTPVAVLNGRVYTGTRDGKVLSLNASSGALKWSVQLGAPVVWQPAIAGGRIYAGLEDGSLVCFQTNDPTGEDWAMWGGGPSHNGPTTQEKPLGGERVMDFNTRAAEPGCPRERGVEALKGQPRQY
jgi:Ca-activated chloride channel family protein